MFGEHCLCDGRRDIICTETECSIAGPGEPFNANICRKCYLRLGGDPAILPGSGHPGRKEKYTLAQRRANPCINLGPQTGESRKCNFCANRGKMLPLNHCNKFGVCSLDLVGDGTVCCNHCSYYETAPPAPEDYFDRIYVINLRRRPDRYEDFRHEIRIKGWPFKSPIRFDAVDPHIVGIPSGWEGGGGAYGCMRSHQRILEQSLMAGLRRVLILEDDVVLCDHFLTEVARFLREVPEDWDQLMLGGQHMIESGYPEQVKPGIVKCRRTERTHAYAVQGKAMKDLYLCFTSYDARTHCDKIMGQWQKNYKVYAPDPFVCGQSEGLSDISALNNPRKFWRRPKGDEPVVLLKVSKEIVEALREVDLHTGYRRDVATGIDNGLLEIYANGRFRGAMLARWMDDLQSECVSTENLVLGIWHPDATIEQIQGVWKGPVYELVAETLEEAREKWEMYRRKNVQASVSA